MWVDVSTVFILLFTRPFCIRILHLPFASPGAGLIVGYPKYPKNDFCDIMGDETKVAERGAAFYFFIDTDRRQCPLASMLESLLTSCKQYCLDSWDRRMGWLGKDI